MALETLRGVEEIGGFPVYSDDEVADGKWSDVDPKYSVCIHHGDNTLCFRIQDGPVKENGVNGCQVDTVIQAAFQILAKLNEKFPCKENTDTLMHLDRALTSLELRTKNREERGVEGTSQA